MRFYNEKIVFILMRQAVYYDQENMVPISGIQCITVVCLQMLIHIHSLQHIYLISNFICIHVLIV